MSNKKKSLRDELAELLGPAPARDHDPDALELGDGAALADDADYEEARRAPSRRAPEKAMLMRGDIALEDAAYRGRKSSRAAVFGEDDAEEDDDDDDEDVDLELGSDDGEEEEDEEEGHEGAEGRRAAGRAGSSGRGSGAGAAAAGGGRRAVAANGHGDIEEDGEADGEEGEEEEDGMLPSGSGSDPDDEDGDGEGDGEGADGEEGEEAAAAAAAAAVAAARRRKKKRAAGGDELEDLEAEYEALQEEDEQQMVTLREKGERDRVKGVAVRHQQVLYERSLEQRILLQKCLQASNGLPRPDTHAALVHSQPEVREGFSELAAAARGTLSELLSLQRELMGRTPGIALPPPAASANGSSKRRRDTDAADDDDEGGADGSSSGGAALDSLWLRISSHHAALAPYRDNALDSWHRRTVLSSGSGALRNSGLRALNQSVSSQVSALMRDPAKFIKRTRLTLTACPRVLCEPSRVSAAAADPLGVVDEEAEAEGLLPGRRGGGAPPVSSTEAVDVLEEERDPETYDDCEFYQQLLKEFLDKGLLNGAAAGAPRAAKKRKLVDRRASKGRKLRYHVQEKLVAFMAPVDIEPPTFASQLFTNLFGHVGK